MDLGLTGRRLLVVGAGGIGSAVARSLLREGVSGLALGVRDVEAGRAILDGLDGLGGGAQTAVVHCELGPGLDPEAVLDAAESAVGPLDGLVMAAGDPPWGDLWEVTDDDWQRAIDVMLMGPVRMTRAVLPRLTARGWGRVVLVGGLNGRKPAGASVIAGVVCAGLASVATALGKTAIAGGVTVNVVDPHLTDTPRWRRQVQRLADRQGIAVPEAEARLLAEVPRSAPVPPEDIADTITFLMSDRAASIAGSAIAIDGAVAPGLY